MSSDAKRAGDVCVSDFEAGSQEMYQMREKKSKLRVYSDKCPDAAYWLLWLWSSNSAGMEVEEISVAAVEISVAAAATNTFTL